MIMLLTAVVTTYLLGLYFLYRHWRNTPPDALLDQRWEQPTHLITHEGSAPSARVPGSATKNMNRHNKEEKNSYGKSFNLSFRRRPRRFKSGQYNFRSPDLEAMTAYLRASGYRHRKPIPAAPVDLLARGEARSRPLSFSNLLRDYDNQARNNFTKEAVLFAIIIVSGMLWPIVQTFRGLPR